MQQFDRDLEAVSWIREYAIILKISEFSNVAPENAFSPNKEDVDNSTTNCRASFLFLPNSAGHTPAFVKLMRVEWDRVLIEKEKPRWNFG